MKSIIFFTEDINKIALNSNGDKRMQSTDLRETNTYGKSKSLVIENRRDLI